jgi:hypothetical protein
MRDSRRGANVWHCTADVLPLSKILQHQSCDDHRPSHRRSRRVAFARSVRGLDDLRSTERPTSAHREDVITRPSRLTITIALIGAGIAGCSGSGKKTTSSGQTTTQLSPSQQPITSGQAGSPGPSSNRAFGAAVTITNQLHYVYRVQAYAGPPTTSVDVNGTTENAPPGDVIPVMYANVIDGLADRPEPLIDVTGDSTNGANIKMSVPAADAAAFGLGDNACTHGLPDVNPSSGPDRWCDLTSLVAQQTPDPGVNINPQIQPGAPVSLVLVAAHPIPQGAPVSKIALFAEIGTPVQIPLPSR